MPQEATGRIKEKAVARFRDGIARLPDRKVVAEGQRRERKEKFDGGRAPHGVLSRPFTQDIIFHGMRERGPNENTMGCRRVGGQAGRWCWRLLSLTRPGTNKYGRVCVCERERKE